MDKFNLIAEIRKRPFLWQPHNIRSRHKTLDLWKEVADAVGADVGTCKTKWTQLRNGYRNEERRLRRRIEWLIQNGKYNPSNNYNSKWVYFKHLKFLNAINEDSKSNRNDSDQGSNCSTTEDLDDDFEIELVIDDALSECEDQTETNNGTPNCSKSENLKASGNGPTTRRNKAGLRANTMLNGKSQKIAAKEKLDNKNKNLGVQPIKENFSKPSAAETSKQDEETSTLPEHRQLVCSENPSHDRIIQPQIFVKSINEVQNAFCLKECSELGSLFIKQEPGSSGNSGCAEIQASSASEGKESCTETSANETIQTGGATVEEITRSNNHEAHGMEVVRIKEEPLDNDESMATPPESTTTRRLDTKCTESSRESQSAKRLRLGGTPSTIETCCTSTRIAAPCSNSSCHLQDADSANTFDRATINDMDYNFLISFMQHMKAMSQYQNLKFRSQLSNLMLTILSSRRPGERDTANSMEKHEQSTLLRSVATTGDPDCNFLVSFLPHLRSMSRLENLHFRAKVSNLVLNIFAATVSDDIVSDSTT